VAEITCRSCRVRALGSKGTRLSSDSRSPKNPEFFKKKYNIQSFSEDFTHGLTSTLLQEGFKYHHAEESYLMMTYWIPDEPNMLPANASHQVGVGGFVINDQMEVCIPCF
jgi:hypothetical protein